MKKIILLLICSTVFLSCKTTYIYLVRHGEKAATGGDNPHLTDEGKHRAMDLRDLLKDEKLKHVYATQYFRTIETGTPTASAHNLQIEQYRSDTLPGFVKKITAQKETVLIVGHSNTLLTMLDLFHVAHTVTTIPENDYDNLFVITVVKGKIKSLRETTYGKVSP